MSLVRPSDPLREANRALAEYIDRLWAGRSAASAPLTGTYVGRLASAARLASMLMQSRAQIPAVIDLLSEENRAFPREFLATDDGREARSAFNALRRAAKALEGSSEQEGDQPPALDVLVGEELSSVSFVRDYLQLVFDGPSLTVFCAVLVRTQTGTSKTGDAGFRDRLCEAIGRNVTLAEADDSAVRVEMGNCIIEIDLAADFAGPEKLLLHGHNWRLAVWA